MLTSRLGVYLADELAGAGSALSGGEINTNDVQALQQLEEPARTLVLSAYTNAITDIFLFAIPIIALALLVVLMLKEIPLRTSIVSVRVVANESEGEIDQKLLVSTSH